MKGVIIVSDRLWIAFKLCIFDLLITIFGLGLRYVLVLWIAFKLCIFDLLITITHTTIYSICALWIAFKLCIFDLLITMSSVKRLCNTCVVNCFQTLYLWPTDNNILHVMDNLQTVVNCFQTLYLWPTDNNLKKTNKILHFRCELLSNFVSLTYLITICLSWGRRWLGLWIAFKLCIFDLLITIFICSVLLKERCELLSNFVSLTYW